MKEKIQETLDEIRPVLQADGGDVELVDVDEGVVSVKLTGACAGLRCASADSRHGEIVYIKQCKVKSVRWNSARIPEGSDRQ